MTSDPLRPFVWTTLSSLLLSVPVAWHWRRGDTVLNCLGVATTVLSVAYHGTARRWCVNVRRTYPLSTILRGLQAADQITAHVNLCYVLVKSEFSISVCLCNFFIAVMYLTWLKHLSWNCYLPEDPEFRPLAVLAHMTMHALGGLSYTFSFWRED